jgi:hypothetical protein
MHVQSATLQTWENYGADWNCSDTWPLRLYWVTGAGSGTNWNNLPSIEPGGNPVGTDNVKPASNPNSSCSNQQANFDVTSIIRQAASNNWNNWQFGLFGDENKVSTNYGLMRVGDNPDVITVFDLTPNVPTNMHTTPDAHDNPGGSADPGCNQTGNWGWIGKNNGLALNADISANITGENVQAEYQVWDNKNSGNTIATPDSNWYTTSGQTATPIGITLKDGHQYGWSVSARVAGVPNGSDGGYTSNPSVNCHFNVDLIAPAVPAVTSTDFPPSGSNPGTSKYAGQSGSFTFTTSDPVPGGCTPSPCLASGVAYFEYSLNTPIPANGASHVTASTDSSGTATSTLSNLTVGDWGTNTLYVDAVDNAGNVAQTYQYNFYAPWNPTTKVVPGDVNGDGIPDLLGTTSSGNLVLYPGNKDPGVAPVPASGPNLSPDLGTDWNTYQITHRGSFTQQPVDDLFAHKGPNLYAYFNNPLSIGTPPEFADTGAISPISRPTTCSDADNPNACSTYNTTTGWSPVTQILAPGDAYSGSALDTGLPSLLTVENGQLWLYQGQGTSPREANPILLGSSAGSTNWSGMTLIAPGQVNGKLTIWARDNATGAIYSYPISIDSNGNNLPTLNLSAPGSPPAATSGTIITPAGSSLTASSYPAIASPGPLDNSSYPGLYAEDTTGKLWYYPGQSGTQPISSTPTPVGTLTTPVTQLG